MNHYAALGLAPGATVEDIREAYLARVRKLHPDVAGRGATTRVAFDAAVEAYGVLSDPKERSRYDEARRGRGGVGSGTSANAGGASARRGPRADPFSGHAGSSPGSGSGGGGAAWRTHAAPPWPEVPLSMQRLYSTWWPVVLTWWKMPFPQFLWRVYRAGGRLTGRQGQMSLPDFTKYLRRQWAMLLTPSGRATLWTSMASQAQQRAQSGASSSGPTLRRRAQQAQSRLRELWQQKQPLERLWMPRTLTFIRRAPEVEKLQGLLRGGLVRMRAERGRLGAMGGAAQGGPGGLLFPKGWAARVARGPGGWIMLGAAGSAAATVAMLSAGQPEPTPHASRHSRQSGEDAPLAPPARPPGVGFAQGVYL